MKRTAVLAVLVAGCVGERREEEAPVPTTAWMEEDRAACEKLAEYCATADRVWKHWREVRLSCIHRKDVDENGLVDRLRLFGLEVRLDPEAADDDSHAGVRDIPADRFLSLHLSMKNWMCLVTEGGDVAVFPPERRTFYETPAILEAGELAEVRKDKAGEKEERLLRLRVRLSGDLTLPNACAALAGALGKHFRISPALWCDTSRIVVESRERPASEIVADLDRRRPLAVILRGDVLWFVER